MDSHDLPRSLVPARVPQVRTQPGVMAWPTPAAQPAPSPSPQILRTTMRGIRRYWWLVLGLWTLGSAGLAAVILMKVQPLYESESYIRVEEKPQTLYVGAANNDLTILMETLVELIRGTNVLSAAVNDPTVMELPRIRNADDPVQELRKAISVRALPKTYLIAVSMSSRDPNEAFIVVNAVVRSFLKSNREWVDGLTLGQINQMEEYLELLNKQASELEVRWKELVKKGDADNQVFRDHQDNSERGDKEKSPIRPANSRAMITIEEYKEAQKSFYAVSRELITAQSMVDALRLAQSQPRAAQTDESQIQKQMARMFQADSEVIALGDKMLEAQSKLTSVQKIAKEGNDPAARKHRQNFEALKARYDDLWATRSPQYREHILNKGADPGQELREAEIRLQTLKLQQASYEKQMKEARLTNTIMATDEVEISLIRDHREDVKEMQGTIQRKLDDLKYSSKDGARIKPYIDAVKAGRPKSDSRFKYLAMTPVGVLLAVLGLVVALELRSARVSDPDQLSSKLRHEVFPIAPLPSLSSSDGPRSIRSEQKLARFVQSLDHLRVALCDGGIAGQGRCVLITSAMGGEGKTTLSAHLAARCANAGTSLLLIDADMRRGSLGRLLDVPPGPGLADVLNGDISLEEALGNVQAGGFSFLSAGSTGIDPSRILTSSRFGTLIEQLRGMFDLVLIDSPPILPVPDALLMGRHVDGVVMASRFDASRLPLVERASRQLAMANIPVLGMVVNGAQTQTTDYGKYHYSYQATSRANDFDPGTGVSEA